MAGVGAKSGDERVGRYAIQGEIATGGMATVHYGRLLGPAGFTRPVAIKRLHPQFAKNPDFVAMFLDEARLASRILHPNVVSILDVVAEGGELFLVMELVPGESLSKLVRACPAGVPIPIAVALAVGMLEGLHAAHEAVSEEGEPLAIVHRDVSPQNVLVGTDGVARLIDFGVAKAAGNATLTRDGQVKGKVAYMAPEQIRSEPIDRRADIYAASVVLWEMLTGKRFWGSADSEAALMLRALDAEIAPPSKEQKLVSPALDAIVLKGLERSPQNRFATAREMAQALERVGAPAATRDVAAWLEGIGGESAAQRAQRLNELDASIATELPGQASAQVLERVVTSATLAAPAISKQPESLAQGRSRTGLWVAIAVVLAGAFGFFASRFTAPSGAAPREPTALVPTALPSAAPSVTSSTQPASPTASSNASAPAASAAASTSASATHVVKPTGPTTKPAGARCTPPFVITPDGVKQYKPECLR